MDFPGIKDVEAGGSQVRGQPQQLGEALCNLVRPCFKIRNKIGSWTWWRTLVIPVLGRLRQEYAGSKPASAT